jgi:hypothetical protein
MYFENYVPQGLISVAGPGSQSRGSEERSINDPDPFGLGDLVKDAEELGEMVLGSVFTVSA